MLFLTNNLYLSFIFLKRKKNKHLSTYHGYFDLVKVAPCQTLGQTGLDIGISRIHVYIFCLKIVVCCRKKTLGHYSVNSNVSEC